MKDKAPSDNDIIDPNFDPLKALDNVLKDIRADVGVQKLLQDKPLHPDELFAGSDDARTHLTVVVPQIAPTTKATSLKRPRTEKSMVSKFARRFRSQTVRSPRKG